MSVIIDNLALDVEGLCVYYAGDGWLRSIVYECKPIRIVVVMITVKDMSASYPQITGARTEHDGLWGNCWRA